MILAIYLVLGYFTSFFIVATIIKNNSIVDIGWGLGYVIVSCTLYFVYYELNVTALIANILVSLWGLRLFYYILKRNIFEEEDFRYKAWRKSWGKWVIPRAYLQVFLLQGFFMYLIGSTVFYLNTNKQDFNYLSLIGIGIFLFGYYFQVRGDRELKNHIKNPKTKGSLLTTGLWKLTRHPNYFGEATMWWGVFIYASFNNTPLYFIISPITINLVLYFISTPLLEQRMKTKGGWDEYASKTNMFIPKLGGKK
jgi:steroid 5-alpha reductase family enzyme